MAMERQRENPSLATIYNKIVSDDDILLYKESTLCNSAILSRSWFASSCHLTVRLVFGLVGIPYRRISHTV
jgi:hypothetical protein